MDKQRIAEAYLEAYPVTYRTPLLQPGRHETVVAYHALAEECKQLSATIRNLYTVQEVPNEEPYRTALEMFEEQRKGYFRVSNLHCDHPLWTPEENINFRIVHDWHGHFDARAPFSWHGEIEAFHSQCRVHSHLAQRALFTEIVGQTACYSLTGEFPEQKAILLPEELNV